MKSAALIVCIAGVALIPPSDEPDLSNYRSWTKVNKTPVFMEPMIATLCKTLPPQFGSANPHIVRYFTVYVNNKGKKAMLSDKPMVFPVGSIIIKEKFAPVMSPSQANWDPKKSKPKAFKEPELVTVMIKREKGFNPKCGDWEFRTLSVSRKLDKPGDVRHCVSCHVLTPETDFVFRGYSEQ